MMIAKNRPALLLGFFLLASVAGANSPLNHATLPWKDVTNFSSQWSYFQNNRAAPPQETDIADAIVDLPHTWNAHDTLRTKDYRRDASWYVKQVVVTADTLARRCYVRFGAAGQQAEVYVNGKKAGEHLGGYAAFCVEVTDHLKRGNNQIAVRVSNAENPALGPFDADFTFYGGLYRQAHWLESPPVCLARDYLSGPGVRVWSGEVSAEEADLHVQVRVDLGKNKASSPVRLAAELTDPSGLVVSTGQLRIASPSSSSVTIPMKRVVAPSLWSPETPTLYTLRVRLYNGLPPAPRKKNDLIPEMADPHRDAGWLLDELSVEHGFRWTRSTPDGQFFLNGKPYALRGVNRHQDTEGYGNALSAAQHERDIRIMKELGANWVRLAHYQQDDYVLSLCDRVGLLVWEEVPLINKVTYDPALGDNYEVMLREMIEQHHNHPSIMMWGIQNEILLRQDESFFDEKKKIVTRMAGVARSAVSHRPITQAFHGSENYAKIGLPELTDLVGYNLYPGWYGSQPENLSKDFARFKALAPDKPHFISEYGAGSDVRIHVESSKRMDFSEEWQRHYLESYLDQFETMPLCGAAYWNLFDFGSATRGDSRPHVNQKGLIGFDHTTKKDVWYLMKSRWSEEPVLYLASPRFTHRKGDSKKTYRVYTNFDEVELFHQGQSLGVQLKGFEWEVDLEEGVNSLLARGRKRAKERSHGFSVLFTPSDDGKKNE